MPLRLLILFTKGKYFIALLTLLLIFSTSFSQSIFTSTINASGDSKKLPVTSPRFPTYFFEWSVGESTLVTTNTNGNLQVTHGVLQGYLLINPVVPDNGFWFPDEIKIYPNPVETDFSVEVITGLKGVLDFKLFSSSGATVYHRPVSYYGTGLSERFNIGYLPSGTYILRITLNGFKEEGGYLLKQGGFKIIKLR